MRKFLGGGIVMLLMFGGGMVWLSHMLSQTPDVTVGLAIGSRSGETLQLDIVVSMKMVKTDPPRHQREGGAILWRDWVAEHFDLRDAAGEKIDFNRNDFSSLITGAQAGVPEFFLHATINPSEAYTLEYIPVHGGTERYRYSFTAPEEALEFARPVFEPVGE